MKKFNYLFIFILIIFGCIFFIANLTLHSFYKSDKARLYQIEIHRIEKEIIEGKGINRIDLEHYQYIKGIQLYEEDIVLSEFYIAGGSDYTMRIINGNLYRFDYIMNTKEARNGISIILNTSLIIMTLSVIFIMIYMKKRFLKPFHQFQELPIELSKGNMSVGLKEYKSRFFGRFIWGLDMLREHMEKQKEIELSLHKEKKTLILALSHDIKTPLSAIKLYASALIKNLYPSEEKKKEIAININDQADKIEQYVFDIMKASKEDFLNLPVKLEEFYLDTLVGSISEYYKDKLSLLKTEFSVEDYDNVLLKGDLDRSVEVLQNIMENAIKYGDGKSIHISFCKEENYRLITVSNSGMSLCKNEIPYIFDSFWRGSNIGNNRGSGLGLYICRKLIQKMEGDIFVDCTESQFKITVVWQKA